MFSNILYRFNIAILKEKMTKEILKPLGLNPRDYFYGVDYVAKYESNPDYLDIDDLPDKYR